MPQRHGALLELEHLNDAFRAHVRRVDDWNDALIDEFESQMSGSVSAEDCTREDLVEFAEAILSDIKLLQAEAEPLLASHAKSEWGTCL